MAVLSTFRKEPRKCPVCNTPVYEEFMMTGGLRQVSLKTTNELRTYYKNFQDLPVVPFIYEVITCPSCLYSSFVNDFNQLYTEKQESSYTEKDKEKINSLRVSLLKTKNDRENLIKNISNVNFKELKNLETALAAYMLAIECYNFFNEHLLPHTKQTLCALRAAWIASDLKLSDIESEYYRKAHKLYTDLVSRPDDSGVFKLGPDWGKNFGFDGARYIKAVLDLKFLNDEPDIQKKFEILKDIRATFSKIRGFGKASQQKPGPLLKHAEDMFEEVAPIFEKVKAKVESGDYTVTEDIKVDAAMTAAAPEPEQLSAENNEEDNQQDISDVYHSCAMEIVKYAQKSGINRASIKELEKILRTFFKELVK